MLDEYKELFSGIGKPKGEINITLKPNVVPYVVPVCRVAHSLQEPLKQELDRLIKQGIIVPLGIDEPSELVNSFRCVRKPNGKIRLCLDLTQTNKFIVHLHHDSKPVEDLLPKLSGAKIFSIANACSSFFMMLLNKHSSYLTTFATMYGRFRYVHVPMGACLSSDCFQHKMDEIFGPIEQCCSIADDIIVFGYSEEDHDRVLFVVLYMAKCVRLHFNPNKCIFCYAQIPFFGMIVGAEGIKPDTKKIKALQELPLPNNMHEMQSFLGIVNYLSRFSPKIANPTSALRQVIKKGNVY